MKSSIFLIIASVVIGVGAADASQNPAPIKIRLQDVVEKVSNENLEVYQGALKVYQAKKQISFARGNLLPKLNFWRILSTPFDPKSLLGIVSDIAPFLIPSNWFQLKANKQLYFAEQEGYRALWANEVLTAKALYVHLLYDRNLLSHIMQSKRELETLRAIVKSHEVLGGAPQGASRDIEIRVLALDEDTRSLQILIEDEASLLAYMMGFGAMANLELEPLPLPKVTNTRPLNYNDYEARVLSVSPELRQYEFIINASKYVKKTAMFSLFGVTNESRGTGGGIFDNVPIQDGLGFGTPASIKIAKSQTEGLKIQKQAAEETLKRQLRMLIVNYNLDLENFPGLARRTELTNAQNQQLYTRLKLGDEVEMFDLIEASRNHIQADTALFAAQFRFLINQDKFNRLLFTGDYARGLNLQRQTRPVASNERR